MESTDRHIDVLDKGFVKLVDVMGEDISIPEAARVSYKSEAKSLEDEERLLRYLMNHEHTSPFEMCEMKFHMKLPIFVARQLVRHRTASINETSGRYREMEPEFYIPEVENIKGQDTKNKQGSKGALDPDLQFFVKEKINKASQEAYAYYTILLECGVSREIARIVLPLNLYTEWYWKCDLRNILHLLHLRLDPHAQWETRQYAGAIAQFVAQCFPITWEAFQVREKRLNEVKR